jgi:hypothetical protein
VHFALHVTRLAIPSMAQQPHEFAHRLAGPLIGNAVHHDNGDAIGFVHGDLRTEIIGAPRPSCLSPARTIGSVDWRNGAVIVAKLYRPGVRRVNATMGGAAPDRSTHASDSRHGDEWKNRPAAIAASQRVTLELIRDRAAGGLRHFAAGDAGEK